MKKIIIAVSLLLTMCIVGLTDEIHLKAEAVPVKSNGKVIYTFDELKDSYINNNITYQRKMLSIEQQLVKYEIAKEQLELWDSNGITDKQRSELELQSNLLSFYKENQDILIENLKKEYECNLYKLLAELKILKEQRTYYYSYKDYLARSLQVEEVKLKRGRSTRDMVNEITAAIEGNDADIANAISEYEEAKEMIYLGNSKDIVSKVLDNYIGSMVLLVSENGIKSNAIQLETELKAKDTQYMEMVNSIHSYEKYVETLDSSSLLYKQAKLQVLDYKLQLKELEDNIEKYAKKSIGEYHKAKKYQAASLKKYKVLNKKCLNIKKQYEKGRASKLAWYESKVKAEEEWQKYLNYCYQIKVWTYIINNGIS